MPVRTEQQLRLQEEAAAAAKNSAEQAGKQAEQAAVDKQNPGSPSTNLDDGDMDVDIEQWDKVAEGLDSAKREALEQLFGPQLERAKQRRKQ